MSSLRRLVTASSVVFSISTLNSTTCCCRYISSSSLSRQTTRRGLCWVRRAPPLRPQEHSKFPENGRVSVCDERSSSRTSVVSSAESMDTSGYNTVYDGNADSDEILHPTNHQDLSSSVAPQQERPNNKYNDEELPDIQSIPQSYPFKLTVNHAVNRKGNTIFNGTHWFPYMDEFKLKGETLASAQILEMLGPYMLDQRKIKIQKVVANRTYSVCPVVEGLLDLGNISAVFRSADALGFQSVHVISNETEKRYKKNRKVSMGSEKWLDAELFDNTKECFEELRSRGYRIAVASISDGSVPIHEMDWTIPTAIVFGNEMSGVSKDATQLSDISCYIPMEGMVDSFNVSVAAGIVMHHAVSDRRHRLGRHGDLSEQEQQILVADFFLRHSSRSRSLLEFLIEKKQEKLQKRAVMGDADNEIHIPEHPIIDLNKVDIPCCG